MVERIAELVRDKKIEGISDLRDESDRDGYRVVIELKRDAVPEVVLNQLYRFTPLQTNFGANMVALDAGRPLLMNLKDLLTLFIAFREQVVTRRTKFLLNKARDRAHILVGLAIAVANIDEIIRVIRTSPDPDHRARHPDGARLAGQGRRGDDHADRRSAPPARRRRHRAAVGRAGQGHSRSAPAAPDRARPRGNRRRARQAGGRNRRLSRHPALARPRPGHHQGRTRRGEDRNSPRRARPTSSSRKARSRTRT